MDSRSESVGNVFDQVDKNGIGLEPIRGLYGPNDPEAAVKT